MKKNFIFTFIILFLLSIFLISYDSQVKPSISSRFFNFFSINLRESLNFLNRCRILESENEKLRKNIMKLSYHRQRYRTIKEENERLRNVLKFKIESKISVIPCRIVSRLPEVVNISYIISKGSIQGIMSNAPVLSEKGVFGKVLKVNNENSVIQTLINYNVSVSAKNLRSDVKGIVKWDRGFHLEGVPIYADIREGDTIVTSGKGSVFPEGLDVGIVTRIIKYESSYVQNIEIEAFSEFSEPDVVYVLTQ